ncbi:hypothetical protein COBT_001762, partial [Conglomerata obtusa]
MQYKITNLPRFFNHKTLKKHIEASLSLAPTEYKLSYKLGQSYGVITAENEIYIKELTFRKNICKIMPFNATKNKAKAEERLYGEVDVRDSVTELWNLSYEDQLNFKKKEAEDFYNRKIEMFGCNNFCRNNCQFAFGFDDNGNVEIGFRSKGITDYNLIFGVEKCVNVSDNMKNKIHEFKNVLDNKKHLVYNRNTNDGFLKLLMIRESNKTNICLLQIQDQNDELENCFVNKVEYEGKKNFDNELFQLIHSLPYENLYIQFVNANFEGFVPSKIYKIKGNDFYLEEIDGYQFKISFFSFFQVNQQIAGLIISHISQNKFKNNILLDFCCGSGFFGIMLSKCFEKVIGIEINETCINDAKENIKLNKINNIEIIRADVEDQMFYQKATVILDPPRKGVSKKTIMNIRRNENITEIFYI